MCDFAAYFGIILSKPEVGGTAAMMTMPAVSAGQRFHETTVFRFSTL
jgi:hypothetical protein